MENILFTVEDAIYLKGLGLLLCPGIPHEKLSTPLRVGQPLYIMRPDGTELTTILKEFPMIRRKVYLDSALILLPKDIKAIDVPIGSLVWILESELIDETSTR